MEQKQSIIKLLKVYASTGEGIKVEVMDIPVVDENTSSLRRLDVHQRSSSRWISKDRIGKDWKTNPHITGTRYCFCYPQDLQQTISNIVTNYRDSIKKEYEFLQEVYNTAVVKKVIVEGDIVDVFK